MQQTFIWTLLPHGVTDSPAGKRLRCALAVSMRLQEDNGGDFTLDKFPDVVGWADYIAGLKFRIMIDGLSAVEPEHITLSVGAVEPALTKALFRSDLKVKSYETDEYERHMIRSYPAAEVAAFLTNLYGSVGRGWQDVFPPATELGKKLEAINFFTASKTDLTSVLGKSQVAAAPLSRSAAQQLFQGGAAHTRASFQRDIDVLLPSDHVKLRSSAATAMQRIASQLETNGFASAATNDPTAAFLQLKLFHSSHLARTGTVGGIRVPARPTVELPAIDFHEALSCLGDYPEFMKKLGLVIDLDFAMPKTMPGAGRIRIVPVREGKVEVPGQGGKTTLLRPQTKDVSPYTHFDYTGKDFQAAAKSGSSTRDGLLRIDDTSLFDIVQFDIDGSALKLMNLADHLEREGFVPSTSLGAPLAAAGAVSGVSPLNPMSFSAAAASAVLFADGTASLPTLRSSGISIVQRNRAASVKAAIATATRANEAILGKKTKAGGIARGASDIPEFYAEDLIRGYRVDVRDESTGIWRSLCQRSATYTVPGTGDSVSRTIADEGIVEMGVTAPADGSSNDLYVHESLFHWDGWSLVVPLVSRAIDAQNHPQDFSPGTLAQIGLVVDVSAAPKSLPKLRFGSTYRLRVRAADLAGFGPTLDSLSPEPDKSASEKTTYYRYEPAETPTVMVTSSFKPGESLETPVLRSDVTLSPEEYANEHKVSYAKTVRLLGPPKVSANVAETHGMLDGMDPSSSYELITSRDRPYATTQGEGDAVLNMPIVSEDSFTIPYLPDPIAQGTALYFYDRKGKEIGSIPTVSFYPHNAKWPDPVVVKLLMVEGSGAPAVSSGGSQTIIVQIPKAERITIRFSSLVGSTDIEKNGVWQMIAGSGSPAALKEAAERGKLWMVTPARAMTLVHAVQRPLVAPQFTKLVSHKELGATVALLHGSISLDGKSTIHTDVEAAWTEPVDDPLQSGPGTKDGKAHIAQRNAGEFATAYSFGNQTTESQEKSPAGAMGLTPSSAAVPIQTAPTTTATVAAGTAQNVTMQEVAAIPGVHAKMQPIGSPAKAGKVALAAAMPFFVMEEALRHEFGDTKFRKVTYKAVATTRFREFFLDLLSESSSDKRSRLQNRLAEMKKSTLEMTQHGETTINVLNSARPALPRIVTMLPTFKWEKTSDGDAIISRRCGGGIRVYVERPWYSSGDEELLGIVLEHTSSNPVMPTVVSGSSAAKREQLNNFITRWGYDPIWFSLGGLKPTPSVADFRNGAASARALSIKEMSGVSVDVVGYQVHFDDERKLWFADIEVDPGTAYFPFVRLALARFQPHSIEDTHLSQLSIGDFIQVVPDRTAAVTTGANGAIVVQVAGPTAMNVGSRPSNPIELSRHCIIKAVLERRGGSDMAWLPVENESAADMTPTEIVGSKGIWRREITPPEDFSSEKGKGTYRVVITESEIFASDPSTEESWSTFEPGRRPVYADAIEL